MLILINFLYVFLSFIPQKYSVDSKIVIEMSFSDGTMKTVPDLSWTAFDYISNKPSWKKNAVMHIGHGRVSWSILANQPILLKNNIIPDGSPHTILEPGDKVHIQVTKGKSLITGRGAEKFNLLRELNRRLKVVQLPENKQVYYTYSIKDLMEWSSYIDKKEDIVTHMLDSMQGKLSSFATDFIKTKYYSALEGDRYFKFQAMFRGKSKFDIPAAELCIIYDAVMNGKISKWLREDRGIPGDPIYCYNYTDIAIYRDLRFDKLRKDSFNKSPQKIKMIMQKGDQLYGKIIKENFYAYLLTTTGIKEHSMKPEFESLLAGYFQSPAFPAYKKFVEDYEREFLKQNLTKRNEAPLLALTGFNGQAFDAQQLKGKPTLLYFWQPEIHDAAETVAVLQNMARQGGWQGFINIACIAVKKNKVKSLERLQKQIGTEYTIYNLTTGEQELQHPALKGYQVTSFPAFLFLDSENRIVEHKMTNPIEDKSAGLKRLISHQKALLLDGPYIFHDRDSLREYKINGTILQAKTHLRSQARRYSTSTDQVERRLIFELQKHHENDLCVFPKSEKLFVLSDVEGNFDAFRLLLFNNGIIDKNFNWKFGNGHLVFSGDMFDRGDQVTECLWLTYKLETEARKAGGHVHFVLGNHEIMNLSGDIRYVRPKYIRNAFLMKQPYVDLFNTNAELGKWLRTKNIMVKIGNLLFLHGGVSEQLNALPITIEQINNSARKYYHRQQEAWSSTDSIVNTIFHPRSSPFWFRKYYKRDPAQKAAMETINGTLTKFDVSHIITGHTVVADTVSVYYGGKVINTDTKHARGKSEALLIEGNNFYRVNAEGKRVLLFREEEK